MTDREILASKTGVALLALLVAGCGPRQQTERTWHYDQDIRERVFMACLEKAPAGPQSTKYNDWDEVVSECASAAGTIAATGSDSVYTYKRAQRVEQGE